MSELPPLGRRERRKEETRQRIVKAALDLFAAHGFEATTMEGIAEAADVAKGTLYSYFPVKEAIILAYIQDSGKDSEPLYRQFLEQVPDMRSRLHGLYQAAAQWFAARQDLLRIYLRYRLPNLLETCDDPNRRSGFEARLVEVITAGQAAGELRRDLAPLVLARLLEGMSLHVWIGWLKTPDVWPLEESFTRMVEVFLDGAQPNR